MTNINISKAIELKSKLVDFVYDAEGEMAVALEAYSAEKSKTNSYGIQQQNLIVDLFSTNGNVKNKTPLDIFLTTNQNLTPDEKELIKLWQNNFIGLFEIQNIQAECYQLMNWLTAKTYLVHQSPDMTEKEIKRLQPGEIIVTILAPLNFNQWFFFSDRVIKGKLSQPKLAVAVGEFRDNYPEFLYADAPELLEQSWDSVAEYHQEFVSYFGKDNFTLPGYKLNKKIAELQQKMNQKRLAAAGIDTNKSLGEILSASGREEKEFRETAQDLGLDNKTLDKIIDNKDKLAMVTPKINLPAEITQAEKVMVFSHPKWGQVFLPNFIEFMELLAAEESVLKENNTSEKYIKKYLELPEANYYIWQQLKQKYPNNLEKILQSYLKQDSFNLENDLDSLLLEYNKKSEPELPAIASVPLHLNNLFEAAVAQVQKKSSKSKKKSKKKGFLAK